MNDYIHSFKAIAISGITMNALTHPLKRRKHTENSFKVDKERKFINNGKVVVHSFSGAMKKRENR